MAAQSQPLAIPQAIAAQTAAGVNPGTAQSSAQRRQFLAQMLANIQSDNGNLRSPTNLGLHLLAQGLTQYGLNKATREQSAAQRQLAEALYPDDKKAQLRWLVDPEGMNKSASAAYAPNNVKAGETVTYGQGGPTYTAPILRDDGGVMGNQTLDGFTQTGVRAPNFTEQTGQQNAMTQAAQQREAARHNVADEGIQNAKIPIELGMMNIAMRNSNTSAGQLGLGQSNSPSFALPPGYRPLAGGR